MTVVAFPRAACAPARVPAAMTVEDLDRALDLYRQLHALLLGACRRPPNTAERLVLSVRHQELRAELAVLFAKYQRVAG